MSIYRWIFLAIPWINVTIHRLCKEVFLESVKYNVCMWVCAYLRLRKLTKIVSGFRMWRNKNHVIYLEQGSSMQRLLTHAYQVTTNTWGRKNIQWELIPRWNNLNLPTCFGWNTKFISELLKVTGEAILYGGAHTIQMF